MNKQFLKRTNLWGGIAILLIAVVALSACGQTAPEASAVQSLPLAITVDEAAVKRDEGAFILDVRTVEEWDDFHIPASTLIPLHELPDRLDEVPTDKEIVVVCRSGNRSQSGRDILLDAGFDLVTSMGGGVTEWQAKGYPIE